MSPTCASLRVCEMVPFVLYSFAASAPPRQASKEASNFHSPMFTQSLCSARCLRPLPACLYYARTPSLTLPLPACLPACLPPVFGKRGRRTVRVRQHRVGRVVLQPLRQGRTLCRHAHVAVHHHSVQRRHGRVVGAGRGHRVRVGRVKWWVNTNNLRIALGYFSAANETENDNENETAHCCGQGWRLVRLLTTRPGWSRRMHACCVCDKISTLNALELPPVSLWSCLLVLATATSEQESAQSLTHSVV